MEEVLSLKTHVIEIFQMGVLIMVVHQIIFVIYFKDLKESKRKIYKELKNKSGVYLFINDVTNDLYVGSSINLSKRMVSHFYYANSDKIGTTILIRAMKKYGLNNFSLGILEFCEKDAIECVKLEQK
jgi:hypothetical protein